MDAALSSLAQKTRRTSSQRTRKKTETATKTKTKRASTRTAKQTKEKSAKSTTTKRSAASSNADETTTRRRSGLETDLKKYKDEIYSKAELLDGVRLAVQFVGAEAITQVIMAYLADFIPGLGNRIEKQAVDTIKRKIKQKYTRCTVAERKALRSLIRWINDDFSLASKLEPSELMGVVNLTQNAAN
jgi:hypothetical protein